MVAPVAMGEIVAAEGRESKGNERVSVGFKSEK